MKIEYNQLKYNESLNTFMYLLAEVFQEKSKKLKGKKQRRFQWLNI